MADGLLEAMDVTTNDPHLKLHGYFRSSCTARMRLALLLKEIEFEYIPVNIKDDKHFDDAYTKLNPSMSVPTLMIAGKPMPITQSIAGLEYLEEAFPDTKPLLPHDAFARAQVRTLVNIVSNDIQPVTNMKILRRVTQYGDDMAAWSRKYHADGFKAIETLLGTTAGKFCVGDEITLADVCLVPAIWNAERWKLDLEPYPNIRKVYANLSNNSAFQRGHWSKQIDTPEELR